MGVLEDFGKRVQIAVAGALRAWKAGPGVVEPSDEVWGHDDSQYSPSEYGDYLTTSNSIYTCSAIRGDALSLIELQGIDIINGKKQEVFGVPETNLLQSPNKFWSLPRLLEMTELCLCLWGRAYWAVEKDANGVPREIWWMKSDRVVVVPDPVNYIKGYAYSPINGEEAIPFLPDEVIWFRNPNPLDEFGALSPMSAARLAADTATAAAKSNKKIFDNGWQLGGVVTPKAGLQLDEEQAKEIERRLDARLKGVDKAHRWLILRYEAEMKEMGVTPKDAEYLGALNWSLEEAARAYRVPLDMIGGQRTYENVKASDRALWMRAMIPESRYMASDLTKQYLPLFPKRSVVEIVPGYKYVMALQDDEQVQWQVEDGQLGRFAITINEWREKKGMEPKPWGDEPWVPAGMVQISDQSSQGSNPPAGSQAAEPKNVRISLGWRRGDRSIAYNSEEHQRLWRRFEKKATKWEKRIGDSTAELFRRQTESVIARVKAELERSARGVWDDPFDKAEWIKKFRTMLRPILHDLVDEEGAATIDDLGLELAFDVNAPEVARFIERRAQRFAKEVNGTTWDELKASLAEGLDKGEGLNDLIGRVETVMDGRIRSSGEVIARTEAIGAMNGGALEAAKQSGINLKKAWLSALIPDRTRESHIEAHNRYQADPIALDQDFEVGGGAGPHPGAIGLADEDINCLCSMQMVVVE